MQKISFLAYNVMIPIWLWWLLRSFNLVNVQL